MTPHARDMTVKQRALIARIKRDFCGRIGGKVDINLVEGMAWVEFHNIRRPATMIHGVIGPGGEVVMTLQRNGVNEPMPVLPEI